MSNTWFQFRQFTVAQDQCAMKVTTDACIQGAWTPLNDEELHVLDIGAGTGLLSLMLAQRCHNAHITAIELDAPAATQATQNAGNSPWHQRIEVIHGDVLQHKPDRLYNVIICNPPFFANSLKNNQQNKTIARHNVTLTMEALLHKVTELLSVEGYFSLLLPVAEYAIWLPAAQKLGLNEIQRLNVRHHPNAPEKRVVAILAKNAVSQPVVSLLTIKDETGQYTTDFQELLGDFYL